MSKYGDVDIAVNGVEAIEAVEMHLQSNELYDLICLDIMMPEMDGKEALLGIRQLENQYGLFGNKRTKIIMTTALDGSKDIIKAFRDECDGYLVKPIRGEQIRDLLDMLGLIPDSVDTL